MTTVELPPEWAFTRDRSSGRIHVAARRDGGLLTSSACNADQAGDRDEVTAEQVSDADPDKLCKRCFRTGIEGVPA